MSYTKSLNEIALLIKAKPGHVIHHKNGYQLIVQSIDLNSEGIPIQCLKPNKNGELDRKEFQLRFIYQNELALNDGIFEVTSHGAAQTRQTVSNVDSHSEQTGNLDFASNEILDDTPLPFEVRGPSRKATNRNVRYESYKELFSAMDEACNKDPKMRGLSHCFWHYTAIENAIAIVESGMFKSRSSLSHIPWNNVERNDTTREVMGKNFSSRVEKYCRFFLRPRNGPSYNLVKKMVDGGTLPVLFAIKRSALWNAEDKATLLMLGCAGDYSTYYFDWKTYNLRNKKALANIDFSKFDWEAIYRSYSQDLDEDIKNVQKSEFLVFESLPLNYIEAIYFPNEAAMRAFQQRIRAQHPELVSLCAVNDELLWR